MRRAETFASFSRSLLCATWISPLSHSILPALLKNAVTSLEVKETRKRKKETDRSCPLDPILNPALDRNQVAVAREEEKQFQIFSGEKKKPNRLKKPPGSSFASSTIATVGMKKKSLIIIQVLCSYITLPLYALVSQEMNIYMQEQTSHALTSKWLWTPIDGEFDDYIVNPKPSGYQMYYVASARELVRINGTTKATKAVVMNNAAESLLVVVTIRAFRTIDRFIKTNLQLINIDASMFYYTIGTLELIE
ncbi:ABC transporter C family member 8 isoform X2 [Canna indica]|uniref:ABC transporter C family member 8 isoform X2 n=1 Tax=Canna indica TaxID=4628 RepID=A0AAQ3QLB7_9LILI|nr:ABC transporter C family member 8 isoform X2 [Canna indica]